LRDERQREADEALKAQMRQQFMAANDNASERDFEAVWPELRRQHMVERMAQGDDDEKRALLARGDYSM
jgi:hypothetical protein